MADPGARRTAPADEYEASAIALRGTVLHRNKFVSRLLAAVMLMGAGFFSLAGAAVLAGADPAAPRLAALIPFTVAALFAYVGLTKCVVRTAITTEELRIVTGLRELSIPLSSVVGSAVVPANRNALLGTNLVGPVVGSHVVVVDWDDANGVRQRTGIGAQDPELFVRTIEEARGASPTGVRAEAGAPAALDPAESTRERDEEAAPAASEAAR